MIEVFKQGFTKVEESMCGWESLLEGRSKRAPKFFFSNDPWGPTTALMSEIADMTHNPISFTEIMSMLWKRLNDHGKNWRHVYKSLVLLDYLIKCGSEKVAQQCRENIYSIETLKDFQHIEDNRDQGLNVREKAKQMVALLYDEERLKNERARFQMTRKRFTQNGTGVGSDGTVRTMRRSDTGVIGESNIKGRYRSIENRVQNFLNSDSRAEFYLFLNFRLRVRRS